MKKVVLGLMLAAVAVGGSAFTNAKKAINDGYLVQPISGVFIRYNVAGGSCYNLHSGMSCQYSVTMSGKVNIPSQVLYDNYDIQEFLDEGWIEEVPFSNHGIYLIL